MSVIFYL